MPQLRVRPATQPGRIIHVTPETAGWTYVGFDVWKLKPAATAKGEDARRETCLVFLTGKGRVKAGQQDFGEIGERMSVFTGKPWSVYVPAGMAWSVEATTDAEIAVCSAPGTGRLPPRLIRPGELGLETRGKGSNIRHVTNIISEKDPADGLLVVEVITPSGNTSSYPSHKHDTDNLPHESLLEETYYHRLNPPQGFAFQRIYTDDRSLDESVTIEDGDVTLVPRGYHPCAAIHGYDLYYLNVMAGPKRTWKFHNDPAHEWLLTR
jgi:5-deoxy-glucuronate isomerase